MNCGHSTEMLALFIEDDLHPIQAEIIRKQIDACQGCQEACRQLQASQFLIKTRLKLRLQAPADPELLAGVRRNVLTRIGSGCDSLGWALRLERAVRLSFRKHGYAFASVAIFVVLSAALWGQVRQELRPEFRHASLAAPFDTATLSRPDRYRDWVALGNGVFIDPAAYGQYVKNGAFPEGTTIVMERTGPAQRGGDDPHGSLNASVKDSNRFEGGWGFFEFTGESKSPATAAGTCRPCHEARAGKDHVFIQFYPTLRSARVL